MFPAERIDIGAASYPERLASIASPPATIWVLGTLPPPAAVAIVGSRWPTVAGREVARAAAAGAVEAGMAVISGLAAGIDTVAHETVIEGGGRTWAVIGSGIDVPTPPENRRLADEIVASGGGLIAEVPPGTPVRRPQLIARDRIQSALALCVVVCQCERSSGAMHTAGFAALQARILAVARPAAATVQKSWSGNILLSDLAGCDPALVGASGEAADLIGSRRPMADIVFESPEELAGLWEHLLASSRPMPKPRARRTQAW